MNKNSMRDVFMYYSHMNGHTERELAAIFDITPQRVYQIIRRVSMVAAGKIHHGPTSEALKIYNSTVINLDDQRRRVYVLRQLRNKNSSRPHEIF